MATGYDAISISFSKKNLDVLKILNEKKCDETFNQNDYVCEAIRFYEKSKDNINKIVTKEEIEKIVDERVTTLLLDNNLDISKKEINENIDLEDLSDDIDIDDD